MRKQKSFRILNPDGSLNVIVEGRPIDVTDLYHSLISFSWPRLLALIALVYFLINLTFALLYYGLGPHGLVGVAGDETIHHSFRRCFFFSVQTFSTIGYGQIVPESLMANVLVTIEALVGLLSVALSTGLLFARFSRPSARVVFSKNMLWTVHDGTPSLMFRMANARLNQIMEAQVRVTFLLDEYTAEGDQYRNLYDLALERAGTPVFTMTWLVVHPITQGSPLFGLSLSDLRERNAELLVTLVGIDSTHSQTIHARYSYTADDMIQNAQFLDVLEREDGQVFVHLDKLHELRPGASL